MEKKIIVKVAAGLGNQMFMYAHALTLSKKLNCKLYIDDTSGFFQKKNRTLDRIYRLDLFEISALVTENKYKFDNYFTHFIKKFLKFVDYFKHKKSFLIEHKNLKKVTYFKEKKILYSDKIYIEGYFESEKYFLDYRKNLIQEFAIKKKFIVKNNKYINMLKDSNSISIHIRRNRFVEPKIFSDRGSEAKKDISLNDIFAYIYKSIAYFENNIQNPKFFIWSNNFVDLEKIFDKKKFIFIENNNIAMDFYLFNFAKHFIVSPSTFHWWGAWLNTNHEKICIRPPDFLNPSNNINFWPDNWKKVD